MAQIAVPPFPPVEGTVIDATAGWWAARIDYWKAIMSSHLPINEEADCTPAAKPEPAAQPELVSPNSNTQPEAPVAVHAAPEASSGLVPVAPRSLVAEMLLPDSRWKPPMQPLRLDGVKLLALDLETHDEDLDILGPGSHRDAQIVGFSLKTEDGRCNYFPIAHEGGDNCDWDVVGWAKNELSKYQGEIVGANIAYDLEMLAARWNVKFNTPPHDVLIAAALLDENRASMSLDAVSKDFLGVGKDEQLLEEWARLSGFHTKKQIKTNLWRAPARFIGPYAEADVDRPLRILPIQLAQMQEEGLLNAYALERNLIGCFLAMRERGVRVDVSRAEEIRDKLSEERARHLAKLKELAGPNAELRAVDSFAEAIEARGLNPPKTPKTGRISITKSWLQNNESDELVSAIQKGRRVDTIINTFINGHILGHHTDGRIYCVWHQLKGEDGGTIARISSSSPNLQNLPARDEEIGPMVRSLFLPDNDDSFVSVDLSQIEYRYLTHIAIGQGADDARRKYNEDPNTDFHILCGSFLGVDADDYYMRGRIKNVNFGKIYGGGIRKLADTFGCSIEEAEQFSNRYNRELPFVNKTFRAAMEEAERQGFVRTISGRKQRFPKVDGQYRYTHAALNRKLQGSAAEHMKQAMVDYLKAGLHNILGAPLVTVHDELCVSAPQTKEGQEAVQELKKIMENAIKLQVPVFAKVKSGPNWGYCS